MNFVTETVKATQIREDRPEVKSGITSLSLYLDLLRFYENHYLKTRLQNILLSEG